VTPRLNKTLSAIPYFGGLAWLFLVLRTEKYSIKWLVLLYLWPLVALACLIPLSIARNGVSPDEMGGGVIALTVFSGIGVVAEFLLWPGRLIATFRHWVKFDLVVDEANTDNAASYGSYFKWFLINKFRKPVRGQARTSIERIDASDAEITPTSSVTRQPAIIGDEPLQISVSARDRAETNELTDTAIQKKPGIFRRTLGYLAIAIVGFGIGAATSEAADQAFGKRKGRSRFNAGEILAAGGKAMLYAVAVILFVIIYPFYYAGSAAWHWHLDDSGISIAMSESRQKDIVYHQTFPSENLSVVAEADGCVYILNHSNSQFIRVRATNWSWITGNESDVITTCLRNFKEELEPGEEIEKLAIWFQEGAMIAQATARRYSGSPRKIRMSWNLAELGIPLPPAGSSAKTKGKFDLVELANNGNVVAREKSTGRTIKFDLNSTTMGGIVDRALSPEGTMLAVTAQRLVQKSLWTRLFGDCEINMGPNKRGANYSVPCEYSTEIWDIERQELLRTIYWPPGIASLVFSGDSKWLMATAHDHSDVFGGTALKFWEL
jgi:hypothetical protein